MSAASHCHGCGAELPPNRNPGNPRKWCSERCRKTQYQQPCLNCGAPCGGSDKSTYCADCGPRIGGELNRERCAERRALVERLWAEGRTSREIAAVVGWKSRKPGIVISVLRNQRGYNLPHRRTPEQIARMTADSEEHLRRARAARKVAA